MTSIDTAAADGAATPALVGAVTASAQLLTGAASDYDGLLALIGDALIVLIGEASHGTQEFHDERARLTRRLIAERGFQAVAVEADWPRRLPRQPPRPRRGHRRRAGRLPPLPHLDVAQHFHGRFCRLAAPLQRRPASACAALIGLTTYGGTVTAASDWDAPAERKRVRPALPQSYEALLHHSGLPCFMLPFRGDAASSQALWKQRLERAIGVIYRPETERQSHYFHAHLSQQFDARLHVDDTRALEPLELSAPWQLGEAPETFPVGV
jgi:erythromycin esterase-like protein